MTASNKFTMDKVVLGVAVAAAMSTTFAQTAGVAEKFDNIIIEKVVTNNHPEYLLHLIKISEILCQENGTPLKGGPFNEAYVLKLLTKKETTYLSGRTKAVYKEGYRDPKDDGTACDFTLYPIRSVSLTSPTERWIANDGPAGPSFKSRTPEREVVDSLKAHNQRRAARAATRAATRTYATKEKHFGHECGYVGIAQAACQLIASPIHEGTGTKLFVHWRKPEITNPTFRGKPIDCNRPPQANIAEFKANGVIGACSNAGVQIKVERFEVNATIPPGIFDVPDFAREAARASGFDFKKR